MNYNKIVVDGKFVIYCELNRTAWIRSKYNFETFPVNPDVMQSVHMELQRQ